MDGRPAAPDLVQARQLGEAGLHLLGRDGSELTLAFDSLAAAVTYPRLGRHGQAMEQL